jgi:carbamoyltransferase
MKVLSFYIGYHDSSLCVYDAEHSNFRYFKSERITGIKRHRASFDFVQEICERLDFIPDLVGFSDGNRNRLGICTKGGTVEALPQTERPLFRNARWYVIDHHLAHVLSAWPLIASERLDGGISVDGCGDYGRRVSIFRKPSSLAPAAFSSTNYRVCNGFDQIGRRMHLTGHLADFAGKVMGAQAYGRVDKQFVKEQLQNGVHSDLVAFVDEVDRSRWETSELLDGDSEDFYQFQNPGFRNWLASVHTIFERILVALFETHFKPTDTIAYSGGAALNTVINDRLAKRFRHLVVPPHCYDGGLSLGCFEAVRLVEGFERPHLRDFPFIQEDEDMGYASEATIQSAANFLAEGKIVGWLQGKGEIGPRALGHRSLLLNPAMNDGKAVMNRVKQREVWRPFAPSVLHAKQASLFQTADYLPYMLRSIPVLPEAVERIPSVVHVDGSSRVQSVNAERCAALKSYGALLSAFEDRTGIPALLNTSFNVNGKPIVSSRAEAIAFSKSSAIDVLIVGDDIRRYKK